MARRRISGFSVDFQCRRYNTLALPCQCVISTGADRSSAPSFASLLVDQVVWLPNGVCLEQEQGTPAAQQRRTNHLQSPIILVPLMLSHLPVHLPPLPLRSQIALFSMPRLISGINFHFHFVNQFHLFMLTSILLLFSTFPIHHPFTLSL